MRSCSQCVVKEFGIIHKIAKGIVAATSIAMFVFLGTGIAMQMALPTRVEAQVSLTIEDLYNSSDSFDSTIGNARIKRVRNGTIIPISGAAPYYTNDDWFRSYDNPSKRVQAKKALKLQNDFNFKEFDKYIRTNRKNLYRIYFYSEEGFIALQFIDNDYVDNIIIRLQPSIVNAFVN